MQHPRKRSGFTLIEIMIVIVILGILASTVLPQFSKSQESAQEAALITSLNMVRSQIQLYKLQHGGALPTTGIVAELTATTTYGGVTYGPYILGQFPANPLRLNYRTVKTSGTADDSTGWLYNPSTGAFSAGNTGTDLTPVTGVAYSTL